MLIQKSLKPNCDIIISFFFFFTSHPPLPRSRTFPTHLTPVYVTTLTRIKSFSTFPFTFSITPLYSYKFAGFRGRRYSNDLAFFYRVQLNLFVSTFRRNVAVYTFRVTAFDSGAAAPASIKFTHHEDRGSILFRNVGINTLQDTVYILIGPTKCTLSILTL